ncbi:uncharacterized protein METZ01_LOCUS33299 [marine metagenome]|uniref:Arsenate reductase (Glutaredoxin) n=1 Tax=marine metagenome TaxID=408172 RepID=A0A381QM70_9ZZZZ
MKITIFHNPRCSKSRKTLELIHHHGIKPTIKEYLKKPLTAKDIRKLAKYLNVSVVDIIRTDDPIYVNANDLPSLDDNIALSLWLEKNISVLQRPIVIDRENKRAIIGRPPENFLNLIDHD